MCGIIVTLHVASNSIGMTFCIVTEMTRSFLNSRSRGWKAIFRWVWSAPSSGGVPWLQSPPTAHASSAPLWSWTRADGGFRENRSEREASHHVLFRSLAVLIPRVGHTMDAFSPFISVLCHSDWLFHGQSCPRINVVHPGRTWFSSPACTWQCSLHYLFLQATTLFPHGVTIVC